MNIQTKVFGFREPNLLLAYADDIDLVGRYTVKVKEKFVCMEGEAKKMGFCINECKTNNTHVARNSAQDRIRQNITIDKYNFENFQSFKYLVTVITSCNSIREKIKQRISQGNTDAILR